jgi:outer membrane immunogenic protein
LEFGGIDVKAKLLSGTAIVTVLAGTAHAADLAATYKAPPVVANSFSWTGFYAGGNIGAGWAHWGDVSASSGPSFVSKVGSASASGVLGGAQAGYNYQIGNWLLGAEGSWTWTDLSPSITSQFVALNGLASKIDSIAAVTGRVGVTFDRWLAYAGGGGAWVRLNENIFGPSIIGNAAGGGTQSGWTVLTGLEYAIDPHWSARVQYNHYDFGTSVTLNPPQSLPFNFSGPLRVDSVVFGINYRFGG